MTADSLIRFSVFEILDAPLHRYDYYRRYKECSASTIDLREQEGRAVAGNYEVMWALKRAACGLHFNPHTYPIATEKPAEMPT